MKLYFYSNRLNLVYVTDYTECAAVLRDKLADYMGISKTDAAYFFRFSDTLPKKHSNKQLISF